MSDLGQGFEEALRFALAVAVVVGVLLGGAVMALILAIW